ncbi:hypothetical protein ACLOJK_006032 [Asimina triloba]
MLGDPAYVRASCEASSKRLDVDCIDLYYQHHVGVGFINKSKRHESICFYEKGEKQKQKTQRLPDFAEKMISTLHLLFSSIGGLKKLVEEGKLKHIGLSEASASAIRKAHAVHPILQYNWSGHYGQEIEFGIGIVAYSPLGRGFLSSGQKIVEQLSDDDFRKFLPRSQAENLEHNARIFERICEIATRKGRTPSQLALAWVHHQGDDVCPIPANAVKGERYGSGLATWEHFERLLSHFGKANET